MGALPTKKLSKSRRGKRLNSHKLRPLNPAYCARCRSAKLPHTACPRCGFHRGREVVARGV